MTRKTAKIINSAPNEQKSLWGDYMKKPTLDETNAEIQSRVTDVRIELYAAAQRAVAKIWSDYRTAAKATAHEVAEKVVARRGA